MVIITLVPQAGSDKTIWILVESLQGILECIWVGFHGGNYHFFVCTKVIGSIGECQPVLLAGL